MGRRGVFVNELNNIDSLRLFGNRVEDKRISKISKAILLSYEGATAQEISEKLRISRTTLITYINKWNDSGIASIVETRGGNKKSPITYEIASDIKLTLEDKLPDQEDYNATRWSCSLISDYIYKKYIIKYSKTAVHSLIKNLGFEVKWGFYFLANKRKGKSFLESLRD